MLVKKEVQWVHSPIGKIIVFKKLLRAKYCWVCFAARVPPPLKFDQTLEFRQSIQDFLLRMMVASGPTSMPSLMKLFSLVDNHLVSRSFLDDGCFKKSTLLSPRTFFLAEQLAGQWTTLVRLKKVQAAKSFTWSKPLKTNSADFSNRDYFQDKSGIKLR